MGKYVDRLISFIVFQGLSLYNILNYRHKISIYEFSYLVYVCYDRFMVI